MRNLLFCISLVLVSLPSATARAAVTFLGPTAYLSAADSPFAAHLGSPHFHLETFEDGELDTPGISQPSDSIFGTLAHGIVVGPSQFTDSVDGDDGVLDGSGSGGHSFRTNLHLTAPTSPPQNVFSFDFHFSEDALGNFPTHFGFVWTDGPPGSTLGFLVTEGDGSSFSFYSPEVMSGGSRNGETAEDRFYGVQSDTGIAAVTITGGYVGALGFDVIEIDHLQYGTTTVPEPTSQLLWVMAIIAFGGLGWEARRG